MEIDDELLCLFSVDIDEQDDNYTITIPKREIEKGEVDDDSVYRVAVLTSNTPTDSRTQDTHASQPETDDDPGPPVDAGDRRRVEIEDIGEKGDGIARVERGYVIIVPGTEQDDQVTVEITKVKPNVAFGEVVEQTVEEPVVAG
ncbi:TRAM domain-containing protein [Halomicrococcus sp. NG-SE-24]|uniref:TRAM domain-containing protein n=1 Tax=Halomicrococcus sp. NG-SE-24 TaxID=3436928 RepID=UPI003D98D162